VHAFLGASTLTAGRAEADREVVSALVADPAAVCGEQACGAWVCVEGDVEQRQFVAASVALAGCEQFLAVVAQAD
jgi:hypothetical protein